MVIKRCDQQLNIRLDAPHMAHLQVMAKEGKTTRSALAKSIIVAVIEDDRRAHQAGNV